MKPLQLLKRLFDIDIPEQDGGTDSDDILVYKSNQFHKILMYTIVVYSVVYTVFNYWIGNNFDALLSVLILPAVLVSILLDLRGWVLASKVWNLFQITLTVALLSMSSYPDKSVLTFFVPVCIGTLINFQGKERVYGYLLVLYTFVLMTFLLIMDVRFPGNAILSQGALRIEWIANLIGSSLISILEIIYILILSQKIQNKMMVNAEHLKELNAELNRSLSANYQKTHQIEDQLQKIQASELELKKLSFIATKTQIGVIVTDHQGKIEWVNEAFTHTSGYALPEVIGKKPKEFLQRGNDQHDPVHEKLSKALAQKENVQVTLLNYTKEGKPYYNQLDITPVFNDLGQHVNFIALQKDITKEREQQEELLRINTRFDRITERSSIGIWEWDAVLNRVNWNDVLIRQYGAERSDITTDFFTFWKACLHPEDRSFVEERSNQLVAGKGEILEDEYRICRHNDGGVRILKTMTLAERDENGNIKRLMGSSIDITDERNFEHSLREKNEQLQKTNAELDNFVYSVSHDLRSPLLSVKGLIALIFELPDLDATIETYLKMADKSINRLDDTIREILEYSRNSRLGLVQESFDVKNLVEQICGDLKYGLDHNFRFIIDSTGPNTMLSDRSRIHTLLRNIIGNAVKYRRVDIPDPMVRFAMKHTERGLVMEIEDNGEGISENSIPKVFDMFYRGTNTAVGTGLGLYICREIINKLGAEIEIHSVVQKGTRVVLTFPDLS